METAALRAAERDQADRGQGKSYRVPVARRLALIRLKRASTHGDWRTRVA